jgi:hypothetical protein
MWSVVMARAIPDRRAAIRRILFPVLLALPLCAQDLRLQVEPGPSGRDGAIVVELESPPGKEPLSLQWDFSIPPAVQIDPRSASEGEAAGSVQKSPQCAVQVDYSGAKSQFCRCIVAGGLRALPNGPVAIVKYSALGKTKPGRYEVEIQKAFAVASGVKRAPLKNVRAQIVISK